MHIGLLAIQSGETIDPRNDMKGEGYEWDQIEGQWKQLKGSAKQQWAKLTDDDLDYIAGTRDKFVGKLQERYGLAKENAERTADEWRAGQTDQRRS